MVSERRGTEDDSAQCQRYCPGPVGTTEGDRVPVSPGDQQVP